MQLNEPPNLNSGILNLPETTQALTRIIIISSELRSYENPQITPISSKIIPLSVTAEFQYGLEQNKIMSR